MYVCMYIYCMYDAAWLAFRNKFEWRRGAHLSVVIILILIILVGAIMAEFARVSCMIQV